MKLETKIWRLLVGILKMLLSYSYTIHIYILYSISPMLFCTNVEFMMREHKALKAEYKSNGNTSGIYLTHRIWSKEMTYALWTYIQACDLKDFSPILGFFKYCHIFHYYKQLRKHAADAYDEMWSGLEARFNASFSAKFYEFDSLWTGTDVNVLKCSLWWHLAVTVMEKYS